MGLIWMEDHVEDLLEADGTPLRLFQLTIFVGRLENRKKEAPRKAIEVMETKGMMIYPLQELIERMEVRLWQWQK